MTIHDATVEVTCDAETCTESVQVGMDATARGGYYKSDEDIEASLVADHDWIVQDGKHFCSPECAGIEDDDPKPDAEEDR